MLLIHKPHSYKKLFFLVITSIGSIGALLGLSVLTYTPELSHAETVTSKKTLADIEYMQDVTADICANTPEADTAGNYQYQLKDSRDQKIYWVAKLKDGNCWMTQNLDLDIPAEGLKAEDTDILEDWNSLSPYVPVETSTTGYYYGGNNGVRSYNPGVKFCANNTVEKCNLSVSQNYGHDAVGNYYSWNAAMAGQLSSVTIPNDSGETVYVNQSVCPKGWKIPRAGYMSDKLNRASGSFYYLLKQYGLEEHVSNNEYNVLTAPLFFVYAGYMTGGQDTTYSIGREGTYWSGNIRGGEYFNAIMLTINSNNTAQTSPEDSWDNQHGQSVRCVARSEATPNNNVDIEVNPTISMDVADEVTVEKNETNPSIVNLDVKVSSNQKYSVGISASDSNLTSTTNNVIIPAKSGLLNTVENGWGIKLRNDTEFTALTSNLQTFYTASDAEIKTIPFTIGISTASDIPNGEYSTNITITATQN